MVHFWWERRYPKSLFLFSGCIVMITLLWFKFFLKKISFKWMKWFFSFLSEKEDFKMKMSHDFGVLQCQPACPVNDNNHVDILIWMSVVF